MSPVCCLFCLFCWVLPPDVLCVFLVILPRGVRHEIRHEPAAVDHARHRRAFPLLAKLKQAGFDGVELPLFEGDARPITRRIRKELNNLGLGCTDRHSARCRSQPDQPGRRPSAEPRSSVSSGPSSMTAVLGGDVLAAPSTRRWPSSPAAGPTADEKKRAADVLRAGRRGSQSAQRHARHRVSQSLRVLLPDHRRRCPRPWSSRSTTPTSA